MRSVLGELSGPPPRDHALDAAVVLGELHAKEASRGEERGDLVRLARTHLDGQDSLRRKKARGLVDDAAEKVQALLPS